MIEISDMNLREKQDYLEQSVGATVLWLQPLEQGLKTVLTFVLRAPDEIDYADPYRWLRDKKTFGKLIGELKVRVAVPDHFSEILEEFLEDRNILIHRFFEHYNLYNPDSYEEAIRMVHRLRHNIEVINGVLKAMLQTSSLK